MTPGVGVPQALWASSVPRPNQTPIGRSSSAGLPTEFPHDDSDK